MNDDARLSHALDMPMSCEDRVHHLSGSSTPTGSAPTFAPITFVAQSATAQPMVRSVEERLIDLNGQFERAVDFWMAENELKPEGAGHGSRMLKEIRTAALGIPVRTPRELALKARILSWVCADLWEGDDAEGDGFNLRVMIEDALALGGLDRLKPHERPFDELLPGYIESEGKTTQVLQTTRAAFNPGQPTLHMLLIELQNLWEVYDADPERYGLSGSISSVVASRIDALEEIVPNMPCTSAVDGIASCAFAFHQVETLADMITPSEDKELQCVQRLKSTLFSISNLLCQISGKSRADVGVEQHQPSAHDPFALMATIVRAPRSAPSTEKVAA